MRKIYLVLIAVFSCCLSYAQIDNYTPVWSGSGNYGFITVGNTNHRLANIKENSFPLSKTGEGKELGVVTAINNHSEVFSSEVSNCNYADFMVSRPEEATCEGDLEIKKAFLSWGGRSNKSSKGTVRVLLRDRKGNLGEQNIKATPVEKDLYFNKKAMYLCHADVTDFVKTTLSKSADSVFSIHVANLQTEFNEKYASGDSIGKFSGWTFTVIFEHTGLPERSILYYTPDKLGDVQGPGAPNDIQPALFEMDLSTVKKSLNLSEKPSMVISSLGAYYTDEGDMLVSNKNKKTGDNGLRLNTPLYFTVDGGNALNNTITYDYKFIGQSITHNSGTYTRGYDLHAFTCDANDCVLKDTSAFEFAITLQSETHLVSDVLLMFGEPNMPEVILKDEATPNVEPGQTIKYSLTVALNENKEQFKDLVVSIPFTEYIDSLVDINLSFPAKDLTSKYNDKWEPKPYPKNNTVFYLNTDGYADVAIGNQTDRWKYWNTVKGSTFLRNLNKMLRDADAKNYERFLADPTSIKQRVLKLKLDSITNIMNVKSDEAIVITFTMKVKDEGDWSYEKNSLKGKHTSYVPQSEMTFTTPSDRSSVVESIDKGDSFNWNDFICAQRGRGLGDGGFGGGGGGLGGGGCSEKSAYSDKTASSKGLYVKDPKHVEVTVNATSNCPDANLPDSITFSFCGGGLTINTGEIVALLANKYDYDLRELRKRDSLTWLDVKQDSIYMMARRHGVNRSDLEGLIDFSGLGAKASTKDTITSLAGCYDGKDLDMFGDSLETVLNDPVDLSNVYMLYKDAGLNSTYQSEKAVSVLDYKVYDFDKEGKYYIQIYSPWNGGKCAKTIPLVIENFTPDLPKVYYAGNEISQDTVIYVCNEAEIENIKIEKSNRTYDIYRSIGGEVLVKADSAINVNSDKVYSWNSNGEIDTHNSGDYEISLWLKDLGCESPKFNFVINVTDVAIKEHPAMLFKDTTTCRVPEGPDNVLELEINDSYDHSKFDPVWYIENQIDSSRTVLNTKVDKISVPIDSAGIFIYSVAYKSGQCISDLRDTTYVEVLALPDTLASDTMYVCAGYKIKEADIINWLTPKIIDRDNDTLKYYKSITDAEDDFVTLAALLEDKISTDCTNSSEDYIESPFYVRIKNSCYSAPSRMTVMARCYNTDAPKFAEGVDSVLYCIGDVVASNLNVFIDESEKTSYSEGYRWQWIRAGGTLPEFDNTTDYYSKVSAVYSSLLDAKDQGRESWSVVRIDSNNCVSKADTFDVIVDENITTFPFVGDTTKTIVKNTEPLTIKTCQDVPFYESADIPTKPTSEDYTIEWFEKTDAVIGKKDTVFLDKVYGQPEVVGMRQYKVRQSTQLGCKGQWLDVNLVVNPKVTDAPEFDRINLCFGDDPVKVVNKNTPSDVENLTLNFYYFKDTLKASALSSVSIKSDSIGEFLKKQSLYTAAYRDVTTGCEGEFVDVEAVVSDLPHLPLLDTNAVDLCIGEEKYDLVAATGAAINTLDNNTKLYWSAATGVKVDADGVATITSAKKNIKYYVKQINELTGCVGKDTTVIVNIDKTFSFKRQKDTVRCFGESFDLLKAINDSLRIKNDVVDADVSFKVYKLTGNTPSPSAISDASLSAIKSDAGRHENQVKRFLVRYEDAVGGCTATDTVALLFKGLPVIKELSNIDTCYALPFFLPELDDKYEYQWYRNDLETKISEKKVALEESETLYLIAKDEQECADTTSILVTIHKNPIESLVKDTTVFCQNTGEHLIDIQAQSSDENDASKLNTIIYDSEGNEAPRSINTDTVVVSGKRKVLDYVVVQENLITHCTSKTDFHIEVRKAFSLDAEDCKAVCEPDSVDFAKHVMLYLSNNESSIGIVDLAKLDVKYGRLDGNKQVDMSNVSALKHIAGRDTVNYTYTISDAENVCVASDTVAVTINFKPSAPKIVDSQDTAFLCFDNVDLKLSAIDTNKDKTNTAIFWGEYKSGVQGNDLNVVASASDVVYTAFTKNLKSGCVSDYDSTFVVVASPVKVDAIDDSDSKRCAGEKINVYDVLVNSFHFDESIHRSFIKYEMTQNGVAASKAELSSVSRTVQDTILFEMTATDTLTGCTASNSVTVIFHNRPQNKIVAPTIACVGNSFEATTEGEERKASYSWQTKDELELSSIASLKINSLSHDTTLLLITNIEGTGCSDTLEHSVRVYATPDRLDAQEPFKFCQVDDDVKIEIARSEEDAAAYKLEWTSAVDSVVVDPFVASAKNDTAYKLTVKQINITADTVCKSEPIVVDVEITKQISISLADTAICMPLDFNLAKYVQTKKTVSDDGFMPELTSVKIYDGGVTKPVADSTSVTDPGLYEIAYTDKYGCSVLASVKLAFINKPTKPVLDTDSTFNLCQNNDTVVRPKVVAGDYEFVWKNIGADKSFAAESLKIDASKPVDNVVYKIVRRDTVYGCESDPQSLSYSVKSPFTFDSVPNVDICEYETINLDSLAKEYLRPLDDLVININRDGYSGISSIDVKAVAVDGVYVIDVHDTVSTCVASRSMSVKTHKKPAITVSGNKPICEGNDLTLTADGADYFYWNESTVPSSTYKLKSTNDDDITVSLLARSVVAEKNKTCEMDSSFVVKVHTTPSTLPAQDLFRFCQTDDDVNIELERDSDNDTEWQLEWTSNVDSLIADKFVASARKDTAYELTVRQLNINTDTVCKSQPIKVKVEITKLIEITLADTAICIPLEFDLAQYAQTKKKVSDEGFMPQLTSVKLYEGGVEKNVDDSTKVTVAGNYKLVYTDRYNCPIASSTNLKFIKKPETPVLDVDPSFNLCVGVDKTVNTTVVAGDYKTSWTMVGNGTESFGDTLALDVAKPISDGYDVVRIDTVYGCMSEKAHFDYNVIEPFKIADNRNIDICEYETLDLDSVSRAMYPDTDLKLEIVPTMPLDATKPFDPAMASAEGVYLLNIEHQVSNCKAQSEIKINNYKKPEITIIGNKPICKGDTLLLKADGGDFYYWNNSKVSVDSAYVPGLADGDTYVDLSVSKLVGTAGKTCKADSVVTVVVEKVPDLITSKLDTAYCQEGKTGALYLEPTYEGSKVVWYSPADDYQTARPNASFAPSSAEAGEYTFKVKQILGNCSTKLQNYVVTIEGKITDVPVVGDTSYCVNETPVELAATWSDYACDVKWTDKNGGDVDLIPSTAVAGQTQYCARLTRGTCVGKIACMTVYVKDRFNIIADVQDTFRFCDGTGIHRLEPNSEIPGVRLNWYNIHDIKRADFAEFDTDGSQNSDTYYVTQSEINGCESDSVKVEVVKVPAVNEQTFMVDTCKGVVLTAADVMLENHVDYEMKSLAKVASNGQDSIIPLGGNIGFNGTYNLTVQTEYGCVGTEKIMVNILEPEQLVWPADGFTSCPGDTVKIDASSSNSWFKLMDGDIELAYLYNEKDSYSFAADEYKQFDIIAMVKGHESCQTQKTLSYNVYTPEKPVVFGTPGVCKGDELRLSVGNIEKDFKWNLDGEILSTSDELKYTPEKGGYLRVSGTDKYGCRVSDTIAIKVVDILTPQIDVHQRIASSQYHINRDTTEVDFEAKINTVDDGMYTYSWNFGDGSALGMSKIENHVYSDTVVKLSRLVNVSLTVTHEFGCVGTAFSTIYIDPSIEVPNTFVIDVDNVFMENYELDIFDRVGNLIHRGLGWDGTYDKNGDYVFHDTYFYSLTYYVGGEEQHKTGYITVVR